MGNGDDELESAIQELFKAYDVDESGDLSRKEFISLELRVTMEDDHVYTAEKGTAAMTLTDRDNSGAIDANEFRDHILSSCEDLAFDTQEAIVYIRDRTKKVLHEREKMGPRTHAGIRMALKNIFRLFDVSGDGMLSPSEWIQAQKLIALEVSDDFDEGWVDEAAFACADLNGDGMLDMDEFLESSFSMFEGVKKRSNQILATLQRVEKALNVERSQGCEAVGPVQLMVQADDHPEFQPPSSAWQDDSSADGGQSEGWRPGGEIELPMRLETVEDVAAIIRIALKLPVETWFSILYLGPAGADGAKRVVQLLHGDKGGGGESNTKAMLQYLSKPNADKRIFVKNIRRRPSKLVRQQRAFLDERESLAQKRTGQCWGLDWETQLVGDGHKLPPRPFVIKLGDALVVELPQTDGCGDYWYVSHVYMDSGDVLSKPVDEAVEPKKQKKSKKKKASLAGTADKLLQLSCIAIAEGKAVMFVDLAWEDQEEKLTAAKGLRVPSRVNTIARIGPIEVEVEKNPPGSKSSAEKDGMQWWNGEKWSTKKGPAKRKKNAKK